MRISAKFCSLSLDWEMNSSQDAKETQASRSLDASEVRQFLDEFAAKYPKYQEINLRPPLCAAIIAYIIDAFLLYIFKPGPTEILLVLILGFGIIIFPLAAAFLVVVFMDIWQFWQLPKDVRVKLRRAAQSVAAERRRQQQAEAHARANRPPLSPDELWRLRNDPPEWTEIWHP
jgi:hypothetical protein